jgi:hypothetical protein
MADAWSHRTRLGPFAQSPRARIVIHVSSHPVLGLSLFTGNMKASAQTATRASNTYGTQTIPGSGCGDRRSSIGAGAGDNEGLLRITQSGVELMNDPQEPLTVVR